MSLVAVLGKAVPKKKDHQGMFGAIFTDGAMFGHKAKEFMHRKEVRAWL